MISKERQRRCGYGQYKSLNFSKARNIDFISYKTTVNSVAIPTISYSSYNASLVDINTKHNSGTFKSLVTQNAGTTYGTVFISFPNGKKLQIVAVDGNSLTESQYYDESYVINRYNSGSMNVISYNGVMTDTQKYNFDGYTASIWFVLMMYEKYGRVGIFDTNDSVMLSVVNVNFTNAFWNGYYMTIGNASDSVSIAPLTTLDIVGHEMMHGVTDQTNGLAYYGESGALNESLSDIFGTLTELYYDNKSGKNLFDWNVGEDSFSGALRSMSNPKLYDQPDTYHGINWLPVNSPYDNGGVHTNSGVGNYMFYILTNPTVDTNDFNYNYNISDVFSPFSLAKLYYNYITGRTGYRIMPANVQYYRFANDLIYNAKLFILNESLDVNLNIMFDKAVRAVNIKVLTDPVFKATRRRKPKYLPKKRVKRRRARQL